MAAFYRFDRHNEEGWVTWFRSPTLAMRWEVDTQVLVVNDTKFILSSPVLKRDGDVLVSRTDLVKWIDPLLRPQHLGEAEDFDTVVIDPGHGGLDNGTRGRLGEEKAYALDLGLRLRDELVRRGLRVVMTRQTDVAVPKSMRGELATEVGRSVLVSLHFNQNQSADVSGLETYAMTPVGLPSSNDSRPGPEAAFGFDGNLRENASLALAAAVHSQILHRCGPADRGVRRARFAVLKDAERAGLLVEGGYLSNLAENTRIHMPEYRARMAGAIAEGIFQYRERHPEGAVKAGSAAAPLQPFVDWHSRAWRLSPRASQRRQPLMTAALLHVEVFHVEGVVLDELAAGFDDVAHEDGEHAVGFDHVFLVHLHLEEPAGGRIHGGVEELGGVHFAEALEAFDFDAVAADLEDLVEDFGHAAKSGCGVLRLDEFEERFVLGAEVIEVQAGFVQLGRGVWRWTWPRGCR